MATRTKRPAGARHIDRKPQGPLRIVAPSLLAVMAAVGALLLILETWAPVNLAVAVVGSGAVGVSWRASHYSTRAARVVLYLAGWAVIVGALWFGAAFQDLTLGGVWSLAIAATAALMRALDRAAGPRDSRDSAA